MVLRFYLVDDLMLICGIYLNFTTRTSDKMVNIELACVLNIISCGANKSFMA